MPLVNHHLSELPNFLVVNPGLNSGYMIPQYTAAGNRHRLFNTRPSPDGKGRSVFLS